MKKYSTLLFSSLLIAASLATNSTTEAQTDIPVDSGQTENTTTVNPASISQGVIAQQNSNMLSIFYNRSTSQTQNRIQYAIWSNENGQDDIQWFTAGQTRTDIPINQFRKTGQYTLHAYITIGEKLVFLQETSFDIRLPKPTLTSAIATPGFMDISIQNIPATVTEVQVPVWSNENGQDDIIWYKATAQGNGTYTLRVPLKQHQFIMGTYSIHLYLKEKGSAQANFATSSTHTVQPHHIPTSTAAKISIQNINASNGTYQVIAQETATSKSIKSVDIATWSTSNQSNIKWRKAGLHNGIWRSDISFTEHQNHAGIYQNHVYVTYTDGSRVGYITQNIDLRTATVPVTANIAFQRPGTFQVIAKNITGNEPVSYAVWSDTNGQDDLVWYTASASTSGTVSGTILLSKHKDIGKYHLHLYQNGKGLGSYTFQVTSDQRYLESNFYPVGQCTWGAKEVAPWVGNYWGNASLWLTSARNAGFKTGTTPRVGAIAVWTGGGYGHVAVVTEVSSTTRIRVKESNYNGYQVVGDYRGWFNPVTTGVAGYIYPN